MKEFEVKLTRAEIDHIQWAVASTLQEVYYGSKSHYNNRAERIIKKLEELFK